ncbi:hypothetical protein Phum_PHUM173560 [Pediculus humanus corporis]|uniref:Uncharacterized protein n=1 Tax=Pediculus humanus subsp. corporis TaxID=121224 RepID=E0VG53_PEDHC|nr:uncharacterized protein Phum_PHUM173560 [Pediculus humanus corporis]EEB12359.1 hypothetical protein Phum_PHUM173560 [Pediculus humanus corporis]
MAIDSLSQSNDKSECDALQKRLKKEIENKRKKLIMDTEKLKNLTDDNNKSTSSFVQNILFEDSEAGVTVLDLFVAIKKAKDKINVLTKNNNDIDKKLNSLKNEVGHMKTRWIQLTEDFINFFEIIRQNLYENSCLYVISNEENFPDNVMIKNSEKKSEKKFHP